jgi:3-hydroxyisobutyrate dehydrogenase
VEGLLYAQRAGLSPEQVIGAIGQGAAGSWSFNMLGTPNEYQHSINAKAHVHVHECCLLIIIIMRIIGPRIVKGNFEPGFYVDHFLKDMVYHPCWLHHCIDSIA